LALIVRELSPGEYDPPHGAALIGLLSFAAGALIPLLGLYLAAAEWALPMMAGSSALALWGMGAKRATLAGKSALAGLNTLLLGAAAALTAWGVGWGVGRFA
jgi:VIT1/CCC1 family predicted Fe2+/Mn2+ transporter